MKISVSNYSPLTKLAILTLLFFSTGFFGTASAADIEESDPSAPCGGLQLIGQESAIYNPSNFLFIVKFTTVATAFQNAGAVKYFERDAKGTGFWRDTGVGDYTEEKTYNVPVKSHDTVAIAYCGAAVNYPVIKGTVSFAADTSQGWFNMPVDGVRFEGHEIRYSDGIMVNPVIFHNKGKTAYVSYNKKLGDVPERGSLTLCPNDPFCVVP